VNGEGSSAGAKNSRADAVSEGLLVSSKTIRPEEELREFEEFLLSELQSPQESKAEFEILLRGYLESDENRAYHFLVEAEGVSNYVWINEVLRDFLLQEFTEERLEKAMSFLDARPDIGTPLLGMIVKAWAIDEPVRAYDWLCAKSTLSGVSNAAALAGAEIGKIENPGEILSRIESNNPPAEVVSPFIRGLIESWAARANNPEDAGEWLNNIFPPQEIVDEAVYSYVNQARDNNLQAAMSWAESIQDKGLRRSAVLETANYWNRKDPEGYRLWKQQEGSVTNLP